MKAWARREHLGLVGSTCRFCHAQIVLVPEVGWIADEPVGPYDMCDKNAWGNHLPSDDRS